MFYNPSLKKEFNPLEKVEFICCNLDNCNGALYGYLQKQIPTTVGNLNGHWRVLFPFEVITSTLHIKWFSEDRGTFTFAKQTVHFRIEANVIVC